MAESLELTYEGSPARIGILAQMLREEGLDVIYEPPMERRGGESIEHVVVVHLVVTAVSTPLGVLVKRATERFLDRFPKAKVRGRHEKS